METRAKLMDKWFMPETSEWAKEQNAHEPTRSYGEELFRACVELFPSPFKALEIGAAWGVSTMAILIAGAQSLRSVDSDPGVKAIGVVADNGFQSQWQFMNMKSSQYWDQVADKFNLIYVDGSHLYHDVRNDLFKAWDRLLPGGYLILDDFTHPANNKADCDSGEAVYGVALAAWELIKDKNITTIKTTTRLLIIQKQWRN